VVLERLVTARPWVIRKKNAIPPARMSRPRNPYQSTRVRAGVARPDFVGVVVGRGLVRVVVMSGALA